jgi:hypothetical protein
MTKITKELLSEVFSWCYIVGIFTESEYEKIKIRAIKHFEKKE